MGEAWVTLMRFATIHEAEVARGLLEAAEIEAILLDGEMTAMNWHLSPALGGVRLQVRPEDWEAALAVLMGEGLPDDDSASAAPGKPGRPRLRVIPGGRAAPEPAPTPREDEAPDADEEANRLARRALGAALIGAFVLPVAAHVYSAWLLHRLSRSGGRLEGRSRAWAAMALAIDLLVLVPPLLLLALKLL